MALKGNQKKLDKNNNNRIDAQDFKILKAEKAKGRGKGLQDEKMKPGKPMKAVLGAIALGAAGALGAKKLFKKKKGTATPGAKPIRTGILGNLAEEKKKELMGKKMGGKVMKAKRGKFSDQTKSFTKRRLALAGSLPPGMSPLPRGMGKIPNAKEFLKRRMALAGVGSALASPGAVKQGTKRLGRGKGRLGAIAALGAAGIGLAQKKLKERMGKKKAEKRDAAKVKKMGGGMMKKYNKGGTPMYLTDEKIKSVFPEKGATSRARISQLVGGDRVSPKKKDRFESGQKARRKKMFKEFGKKVIGATPIGLGMQVAKKIANKVSKKMGGGMMQRPMGYKAGTMIKARGGGMARSKPTKMY